MYLPAVVHALIQVKERVTTDYDYDQVTEKQEKGNDQ
jgi:hypothetical protein